MSRKARKVGRKPSRPERSDPRPRRHQEKPGEIVGSQRVSPKHLGGAQGDRTDENQPRNKPQSSPSISRTSVVNHPCIVCPVTSAPVRKQNPGAANRIPPIGRRAAVTLPPPQAGSSREARHQQKPAFVGIGPAAVRFGDVRPDRARRSSQLDPDRPEVEFRPRFDQLKGTTGQTRGPAGRRQDPDRQPPPESPRIDRIRPPERRATSDGRRRSRRLVLPLPVRRMGRLLAPAAVSLLDTKIGPGRRWSVC